MDSVLGLIEGVMVELMQRRSNNDSCFQPAGHGQESDVFNITEEHRRGRLGENIES